MSDSTQNLRQWRIVALAVVSSTGRPLFLKNFPANPSTAAAFSAALFRSNSLIPRSTVDGEEEDDEDFDYNHHEDASSLSEVDYAKSNTEDEKATAAALKVFANETKKQEYISSWSNPQEKAQVQSNSSQTSSIVMKKSSNKNNESNNSSSDSDSDDDDKKKNHQSPQPSNNNKSSKKSQEDALLAKMDLDQALSLALDCEDYTETETAQLFLYSALDRIDARRAVEERRSGNPFESRGYAVFDRETKTKMKAFVLVRYWGRSLPSECHLPCQTVLTQLIQKATFAFCDPFRDVALDEPLSENLLMDPFFRDILQPSTEVPKNRSNSVNSSSSAGKK